MVDFILCISTYKLRILSFEKSREISGPHWTDTHGLPSCFFEGFYSRFKTYMFLLQNQESQSDLLIVLIEFVG